jgi:hypothetical protein
MGPCSSVITRVGNKDSITKVIRKLKCEVESLWFTCAFWAASADTKGDVAVTEEAEEDRKREDDRARDEGRAVIASGLAAYDHYHKRQRGSG